MSEVMITYRTIIQYKHIIHQRLTVSDLDPMTNIT